jgi:LacI family transcriptional regulator
LTSQSIFVINLVNITQVYGNNMTIREIAKQVGVSPSTVSRVINRDQTFSVSDDTARRILDCAQRIGYMGPTRRAYNRSVSKDSTMSFGYVLTVAKEKFEDSCLSTIIHGIEQEAMDRKCTVAFAHSIMDLSDPLVVESIVHSGAKGIILIGNMPLKQFDFLRELLPHAVSIFEVPANGEVDCVTVELEKPFYQLTRELIEMGHKKIAYIGGETYSSPVEDTGNIFFNRDDRFQGFIKAHIDCRRPINQEIYKNGHWDIGTAYKKMGVLLDRHNDIDAVVAADDKMAIGAMRIISERGLKIPENISVVGFDNIEVSNFVTPRLTTVSYPKELLGRMALRILIENVQFNETIKRTIILPSEIVRRDSTSEKGTA